MKKPLLRFEEEEEDNRGKMIYYVYNHDDVSLGVICNSRVGRFFHWIFQPSDQTFYTNGCLKEITNFITKCYSKSKKNAGDKYGE